MGDIKLGSNTISSIKLGSNTAISAFLGTDKIYPSAPIIIPKYWLGGINTNTLKYSDYFGPVTKTIYNIPTLTNRDGLAMSVDGKYLYSISGGAPPGGYISFSSDGGLNWNRSNLRDNYTNIKCSESGQYVVVGAGYGYDYNTVTVSQDYGLNFQRKIVEGETENCDVSRSGQYMVVSHNNRSASAVKYSHDFGENWNSSDLVNYNNLNRIRISGNGQYVYLHRNYLKTIYRSSNYGVNYTLLPEQPYVVYSLTTSDTGQYVYYVSNTIGEPVMKSSDYGQTFSPLGLNIEYINQGITCSYDGSTISVYSPKGNNVYISTDYGSSFEQYTFGPYNNYSALSRI